MNSDFSAARARLDAAEAKREEVLLRHIANGVMIESRTVEIDESVVIAPGAKSSCPAPSCGAKPSSARAASSAPTASLRTAP